MQWSTSKKRFYTLKDSFHEALTRKHTTPCTCAMKEAIMTYPRLLGTISPFTLYDILNGSALKKRDVNHEITAHVFLNVVGEYSTLTEVKLPALCPGLVVMAVQEFSKVVKKNKNPDLPDAMTLTCLPFKSTKDRHEMELSPDYYQPAHFMQSSSCTWCLVAAVHASGRRACRNL